jgi:multidrug resistance efflux pump
MKIMSIDAAIFQTFRKLGADDADAAKLADEINTAIDRRYELHAKQLATRGDVEAVRADIEKTRADLIKSIADSQRWTITAIGIIVAVVAALQKLL